jgi:protein-disulfide isomerase
MLRNFFILLVCFPFYQALFGQSIKGNFKDVKNKEIVLKGFFGLEAKELAKTQTDSLGNFKLIYPKSYTGAGLVQIQDRKEFIVLLNNENASLQCENSNDLATLRVVNSKENESFQNAIQIFQEAEQKLAGLNYLLPLYKNNKEKQNWLQKEIASNTTAFETYLSKLPNDGYAKHYLKLRKLLAEIVKTSKQNPEQFSKLEVAFNTIDFNDQNVIHSGLLIDIINSYFSLLETNLQHPSTIEIIDTQFKSGISAIVNALEKDTILQEEVAQYLFKNFEKRNLTAAAEFLALKMLNQSNCQLSTKSTQLFEQYRKLAQGTTAPEIDLGNGNLLSKNNKQLKLIVFGSSTCPNCQTDYPSLIGKYNQLKNKYSLEVVYISLDTDKTAYATYYKESPFITYCDFKGWETQAAKDYYVNATPTYILLDKNLKVIMKLKTPQELEEVVENVK